MTLTDQQIAAHAYTAGARGGALVTATAVSLAENPARDPAARGDEHLVDWRWGPSIGLWQIRSLHAETGTGKTRDRLRLTDPAFNARSMWTVSRGGRDWSPWTDYKNGKYRAYLERARAAARAVERGDVPPEGEPGLLPPYPEGDGTAPVWPDPLGGITDQALSVALTAAFVLAGLGLIVLGVLRLTRAGARRLTGG